MRYQIGDLVVKRESNDFGVIVGIDKANSKSMNFSSHSRNLLKNLPDIYYVYFNREGIEGPYYTSDLYLKQSTNATTNS